MQVQTAPVLCNPVVRIHTYRCKTPIKFAPVTSFRRTGLLLAVIRILFCVQLVSDTLMLNERVTFHIYAMHFITYTRFMQRSTRQRTIAK